MAVPASSMCYLRTLLLGQRALKNRAIFTNVIMTSC